MLFVVKTYRIHVVLLLLLSMHAVALVAQSVLYSPFIGSESVTRFEVIGKAGNFYWVQKSKKYSSYKKGASPWISDNDLAFEVYDAHLNWVREIPFTITDAVLKQYLVAGNTYFDQLVLRKELGKTTAIVTRFQQDGGAVSHPDTLRYFPTRMQGNDFLLARSPDKSKLLLLGFESVEDASPRLHVLLYNSNWTLLYDTVYNDCGIAQPCLQYDFFNYPLEAFDNSAVKLCNNGDWLMVAPSRRSVYYTMCHFLSRDSSFYQSEVRLPQNPNAQNICLTLDQENQDASVGVLSNSASVTKRIQVAHYVVPECRFDFDTTYRINTLAVNKRDEYLYEQSFMPVPGRGFLFLKEYGRTYQSSYKNEDVPVRADDTNDPDTVINQVPGSINKDDYTRYNSLSMARKEYERGDLRLYYFPAQRGDSTWSGLLNKAQLNELNSSYLSYVCMPLNGRLVFLYNSPFYSSARTSSSTILDENGNALSEGLVFWRSNNILNYQKARQISANELAVPYEKNRLQGFAIIRL